jgi:hypothetical protein
VKRSNSSDILKGVSVAEIIQGRMIWEYVKHQFGVAISKDEFVV